MCKLKKDSKSHFHAEKIFKVLENQAEVKCCACALYKSRFCPGRNIIYDYTVSNCRAILKKVLEIETYETTLEDFDSEDYTRILNNINKHCKLIN